MTGFEAFGVLEKTFHPPSNKSAAQPTIPAQEDSWKSKDDAPGDLPAIRKLSSLRSALTTDETLALLFPYTRSARWFVQRRSFLKGAGVVTVIAAGGGVWHAYDQGVFSVGEGA